MRSAAGNLMHSGQLEGAVRGKAERDDDAKDEVVKLWQRATQALSKEPEGATRILAFPQGASVQPQN